MISTMASFIACLIACAALLIMGVASGCSDSSPKSALPATKLQVGAETITAEIANTDATRTRGLMKRDSLPRDHGMIFVFEEEDKRGFWMRNTRIPLDIIFLDASGKVVSIHAMKPYDLSSTNSEGPAKYAIEVNQGVAEKCGIKKGDVVNIPPEAKDPPR